MCLFATVSSQFCIFANGDLFYVFWAVSLILIMGTGTNSFLAESLFVGLAEFGLAAQYAMLVKSWFFGKLWYR